MAFSVTWIKKTGKLKYTQDGKSPETGSLTQDKFKDENKAPANWSSVKQKLNIQKSRKEKDQSTAIQRR